MSVFLNLPYLFVPDKGIISVDDAIDKEQYIQSSATKFYYGLIPMILVVIAMALVIYFLKFATYWYYVVGIVGFLYFGFFFYRYIYSAGSRFDHLRGNVFELIKEMPPAQQVETGIRLAADQILDRLNEYYENRALNPDYKEVTWPTEEQIENYLHTQDITAGDIQKNARIVLETYDKIINNQFLS